MDLTATAVYAVETGAIIKVLFGLLTVALFVLCAALALFVNLRIKAHVKEEAARALAAELAAMTQDRDNQRLRRRKAMADLVAYHKRVEPLIAQIETWKAADNDIARATAAREVSRLVKLVPRERRKAA